jgi:hypothetical protein
MPLKASPRRATIERAQELSTALNKSTEALNASLKRAQQGFAELSLGVRAAVPLSLPGDDDSWNRFLVFGKLNNDWQLSVEQGRNDDNGEAWSSQPLVNCNREIRLAAVECLQPLFDELINIAEKEASAITTKAAQAEEFVDHVLGEGIPF